MTGLTQSLQSVIWGGMGVEWLDTVTSVDSLGVWGLTGLTCHFSRLSGGMGVDWLDTVSSVVYLMGLGLTGLTQSP